METWFFTITFYNNIKKLDYESYQNIGYRNKIMKNFKELDNGIFHSFSRLVDFYFLRRFLDKEYITNAIVYSGAAHSVAYIYMLHKIGFRITHCANCSIQDMDNLNDTVDRVRDLPSHGATNDLINMFVNSYENPIQCSDLSSFPEFFE